MITCQQFYLIHKINYYCTYSSMISRGVEPAGPGLQTLISMFSLVGEGSCLINHGGLLKEQQVLVRPHPFPSHRGSLTCRG